LEYLREIFKSKVARRLFKSTTVYAGANFINQAIPFLLLPVLTRYLTPYDYGLVATFQAMLGIGILFVGMGTVDAIVRGYFDREKRNFNLNQYIFNASFINLIIFLILTILLFFLKEFLGGTLQFPPLWILLVPLFAISTAIPNIPLKLWIVRQKPLLYSLFNVSKTLLEMLLSILLVVNFGLSWRGRIIGMGLSKVAFFILGLFILIKGNLLAYYLNFDYIKDILKYGIPVFFHSLGIVIIASMDRFFLNTMIGVSTTGIYSVGYSVAMIIGFLAGAFNLAWGPILFEKLNHITEVLKIKIVKFTYFYFIFILAIALFLIIIAPYFLRFFVGENFYGASRFIFWLALGYAVHGMYTMVAGYIFYEKKTYFLSIIALITVSFNIIFNYTLIKLNGAIGAAQATFLTFLCRFILTWYFSQKSYSMPWFSFARAR
jgi:O-antigen/teichoic acid export membrane protein